MARYGGPVAENAQQAAGVAKSRSIESGIHGVANGVGPDALAQSELATTGFRTGLRSFGTAPAPQGVLGEVGGLLSTATKAVGSVLHAAQEHASGW